MNIDTTKTLISIINNHVDNEGITFSTFQPYSHCPNIIQTRVEIKCNLSGKKALEMEDKIVDEFMTKVGVNQSNKFMILIENS